MNEFFFEKQVEGEKMLMAMCKIEMHRNWNVTIEEKKLIVKTNAMRADNKRMHQVWKEIKNNKMERMQRKVNINYCEKCALKKRNTRTPEWNDAMKTCQHLLQEVQSEKKER